MFYKENIDVWVLASRKETKRLFFFVVFKADIRITNKIVDFFIVRFFRRHHFCYFVLKRRETFKQNLL